MSIINMWDIVKLRGLKIKGVIHIGAWEGNEYSEYKSNGVNKIIFIEANPDVFLRLKKVIIDPLVILENFAVGDRDGEISLHVTNFDQSSYILSLKRHSFWYPSIVEVKTITVPCKTIDSYIKEKGIDPHEYNCINIDIQGAELVAFKGAIQFLNHVDFIYTEINHEEMYENCVLLPELEEFLGKCGFHLDQIKNFETSWGDGIFIRTKI